MRNHYKQGYKDGAQGLSDYEREEMIDEIMMRDGRTEKRAPLGLLEV